MNNGAPIAAGIVYALFCAGLAFLNAGGGHGWNSAMPISLVGLGLIPLSFWCGLNWRHASARTYSLVAIAAGLLLDVGLIVLTMREGTQYFDNTGNGGMLWVFLWLAAQAPPILALFWQAEAASDPY